MWYMYICPLYMRCHALILVTCIAVLSHLVVKGVYTCEIWIVGTNNKLLSGPRQTRKIQYRREMAKGSVKPKDEARMDVFTRCWNESCSSMYKVYISIMLLFIWEEKIGMLQVICIIHYSCLLCNLYNLCSFLISFFFLCRLKIIHDSHEFILEFSTVANNNAYVYWFKGIICNCYKTIVR